MKATINRHLFTQTRVDSGALSMTTAIIHCFTKAGAYEGHVTRHGKPAGSFHLTVDTSVAERQLNIDLATLPATTQQGCCCDDANNYRIHPEGYVVFHVSRGTGGYAVKVASVDSKAVVFDSQGLSKGSMLAVTLLRSGKYSVQDVNGRARGTVWMAYPTRGKTAYTPPEPENIVCSDNAFDPSQITLEWARGQLYTFATKKPARIVLELLEADDGENPRPKRAYRLRRRKPVPQAC